MAESSRCPFCSPGERTLKSNALAVVVLSNPRKVPGHFLVIPKRHVEKPWELKPRERKDVFDLILEVQQKVVAHLGSGSDMRQHYRPFLPQSRIKVDHLHYHVYPRERDDTLYQHVEKHETALFEDLTREERNRVAEILGT